MEERRHSGRFPFVAVARVTDLLSQMELQAHTSDLSLEGCFVDTLNPSSAGTPVLVAISHGGVKFTAMGNVVFAIPSMGMGIVFATIESDQQGVLRKWVADAQRERT